LDVFGSSGGGPLIIGGGFLPNDFLVGRASYHFKAY